MVEFGKNMEHDAYKLNVHGNSLTGFARSLEKNIGKEMLQHYYELKLRILNYYIFITSLRTNRFIEFLTAYLMQGRKN